MLWYLGNNWELSIDFHQWTLGFNCYKKDKIFNIFLGPIRLGWWSGAEDFWRWVR